MDNADAHKMLGVTHLHWGKRKIQRTWRGMCYIMLRLEGKEPTTGNIRNYQSEKLGRYDGNTLLTELMPIRKPKVHRWGCEELIPQFTSRDEYYRAVKPRRIKLLRELVEDHKPKAIICYGKAYWNDYQELFEGNDFIPNSQFQIVLSGETMVILTPHFTARSMNGRFDDVVSTINHRTKPR